MISSVAHAHLITSPVFGPPPAADKAELIIVMSGDYRSKKEVAYLFVPAIGKKVIDLGGNLEKGGFRKPLLMSYLSFMNFEFLAPTFKLIGNSMIMGCLEILAESFTLAEKSGIGAKTVQSLVKGLQRTLLKLEKKLILGRYASFNAVCGTGYLTRQNR
jgi:3-hydroxyisobutyrate dehydrogenase-like beta-hydroxyacid dehydrogenase